MLMTLAILLLLLYAVGMVTSYTMGGLIDLLLVVAAVLVVVLPKCALMRLRTRIAWMVAAPAVDES